MRTPILLLLIAATQAQAQTLTLTPASKAPPTTIQATTLQTLPQAEATLTYGTPPAPHRFQGPLIWTVLTTTHLVDPAAHAGAVRETLTLQGADGYTAILALGELSPDFEAKPAILALTLDGKPLPTPRAVIPGDHRNGRSVRDLVAITVEDHPKP